MMMYMCAIHKRRFRVCKIGVLPSKVLNSVYPTVYFYVQFITFDSLGKGSKRAERFFARWKNVKTNKTSKFQMEYSLFGGFSFTRRFVRIFQHSCIIMHFPCSVSAMTRTVLT